LTLSIGRQRADFVGNYYFDFMLNHLVLY